LIIFKEKGIPLEKQLFTWRDMVQTPTSKLDDDAFTRVRIILMNGLESEALRFSHACVRMNRELQLPLARVGRVEQHQQTMVIGYYRQIFRRLKQQSPSSKWLLK
jgi:hypothetical protein